MENPGKEDYPMLREIPIPLRFKSNSDRRVETNNLSLKRQVSVNPKRVWRGKEGRGKGMRRLWLMK